MRTNGIILVEPGVHLRHGHYREKLNLWIEGFQSFNWTVSVACFEPPEQDFLPAIVFKSPAHRWRRLEQLLPERIRILWFVFQSYLLAFRYAKQTGYPVFGLTTSTLLPVGLARMLANGDRVPFGQIVMYGNIFQRGPRSWRSKLETWILNALLRAGAVIFPNTRETREKFVSQVKATDLRDRIVTLYDPIHLPKETVLPEQKQRGKVLLIPGLDDHRRAPFFHLRQSKLVPPPAKVWVHAPGAKPDDFTDLKRTSLTSDFEFFTAYREVEEFAALFAAATWCLVAYRPQFLQGSGLLAQAIAGGTPVLCSRFPFAEELFAAFGLLGELFTFGDIEEFSTAWIRLRNWTPEKWDEFNQASQRFAKFVDASRTTGEVVRHFSRLRDSPERNDN